MNLAVISCAVLLCVAGYAHGQGLNEACGANDACGTDLTCQTIDGNKKCRKNIEQGCTASSTDECLLGAECKGSTPKCTCLANSQANQAKTKCLKYNYEMCNAAGDCISDTCTDEKCACPADHVSSYNKMECKKAAGKECGTTPECADSATCKDDSGTMKCACDNGFYNDGGRCGKKVDETCTTNSMECVLNADCKSGTCKCMDKFIKDDTTKLCKKDGATAVTGSILLLVAAIVTSRLL